MKTFEEFCKAIGQRESSCNYRAKNSLGYLGYYQFGMARLCDLGLTRRKPNEPTSMANDAYEWISPNSENMFLNNPMLQDETFMRHVHRLEISVELILAGSVYVNEKQLSLSGCIAVCHLLGPGGLEDLIYKGLDDKDANGTKASDYLSLFAGYEIPSTEGIMQ